MMGGGRKHTPAPALAGAHGRFDYSAPAEMFAVRNARSSSPSMAYRRFATAAEGIRFVIEDVPGKLRFGVILEVLEQRLDHRAIRTLYESDAYPLRRV